MAWRCLVVRRQRIWISMFSFVPGEDGGVRSGEGVEYGQRRVRERTAKGWSKGREGLEKGRRRGGVWAEKG